MSKYETCDRGFTLRLLREWRMDVASAHALYGRLALERGWPLRTLAQTKAKYAELQAARAISHN